MDDFVRPTTFKSTSLLTKEQEQKAREEQEKTKEITEVQKFAEPSTPKIIYIWNEQLGKFVTEDNPHTAASFGVFNGVTHNATYNLNLTHFPTVKRDPTTGLPIK